MGYEPTDISALPQERAEKLLQDRRTVVPLEPRHNCVASEANTHVVKCIPRNPYTSAVLTHSLPTDGDQVLWHDLAAQSQPDDKLLTTWVGRVIASTLGGAQINDPLIDGTYLYGVGLDLDWENLWQCRMVHTQSAMAFLQDHYFEINGKSAYFSYPLDKE